MIPGVKKDGGKIEYIMENIYKWGPATTGMKVYPDYYTFDPVNEIYEWNGEGPQVGGHAISIVGWGEEHGKKFWWIKNSWGENWGINGYFRMVRGTNNCEIEENVMTGAPDFFYPLGYKHEPDTDFGELDIVPQTQLQQRIREDTGINVLAAGIEPTTGYTRKAMARLPGFDFSAPIKLSELPDFKKFIAGVDATEGQRSRFWKSVKSVKKTEIYESKSNILVITLLAACIFVTIIVSVTFIIMYRKK
jgi:cathepsin B